MARRLARPPSLAILQRQTSNKSYWLQVSTSGTYNVASLYLSLTMIKSLAYFYTRSLIHRPLLCHGSGSAASAATIVLAAAAKHMLQILDLLNERSMHYTFPMNRTELLLSCGFAVLWQSLDLEEDGKLVKDNQKSLTLVLNMLAKGGVTTAAEFQRIAGSFVSLDGRWLTSMPTKNIEADSNATRALSSSSVPTEQRQKSTRKQLQAIASKFSSFSAKNKIDAARRATVPQFAPSGSVNAHPRASSTVSLSSTHSAPIMPLYSPALSELTQSRTTDVPSVNNVNLDYFPFITTGTVTPNSTRTSSTTMLPPQKQQTIHTTSASWDHLLDSIDTADPSLYSTLSGNVPMITSTTGSDWTMDAWAMATIAKPNVPQSLLSFSEESLTSGDDLVFSTASSHNGSSLAHDSLEVRETYQGITIPFDDEFDFHDLEA